MNPLYVLSLFLILVSSIIIWNYSIEDKDLELYSNHQSSAKHQLSNFTIPIIIVSTVIFSLGILNNKNKLLLSFKKIFLSLFHFEVSKRVSLMVIAIVIVIFILINLNELSLQEQFTDFYKVENKISDFEEGRVDINAVKYFFLYISDSIFQNVRIVPLIASIALMIMTYLFTVQISQKRFAGLISMGLVLQSSLFLTYSSSSTHANFWILLYLVSLYLINKKSLLSPVAFIFSIFTKYLTPIYLPVTIYHISKSKLTKNKKIILLGIYFSIPAIAVILHTTEIFLIPFIDLKFDLDVFFTGFKDFSKFLINDWVILIFLIPVIVGLFVLSKKGLKEAETVMIFIFIVLLSAPIIPGFFLLNNHAYRFVPLVVFFAIGTGILFSSRINLLEASKSVDNKWSYVIFIPTIITVLISMTSVVLPNIIEGQYRLNLTQ